MLFTVKRDTGAALGLALVLALLAVGSREVLGIAWETHVDARTVLLAVLAFGVLVLSDGAVQAALVVLLGDTYRATFRALLDYFAGQSGSAILAGGVLAAAEELLFRGVLLAGLRQFAGVSAPVAVLVSALAFGLAHYVPERQLRAMTLWAVLEGALLGAAFVGTGSLVVPVLAHALHDVAGFSLFAWLREHGYAMPEPEPR